MTRTSFLLISLLFVISLGLLIFIPSLQRASYQNTINSEDVAKLEPKDRVQLQKDLALVENSFRTTLAQIIGGSLLLLSLYLTYRNVNIAQENARIANENLRVIEEGKLTDRFSKAVELLGNEKLEIRLGGVYALERIALDSQKDHWTVMEVLTAFVRENSHKESRDVTITEENLATTAEDKFDVDKTKPREDIQAIATVIGRRRWSETESQALDLKSVILTGCNISEATLTRADLREANLVGANLTGANLSGATLLEADLHEAFLNRADLSGANLMEANLDHASLTDANLCGALLVGASLNGAMLTGTILEYTNLYLADLGGARNLELTQVLSAKYEDSILPPKIAEELKEHLSKKAN